MSNPIRHNPFATRFTRPGKVPFLLREGESLGMVANHFCEHRFVGQIVGPHGCGKTTLTHALDPFLRIEFPVIRRVTIRGMNHVLADQSGTPDETDSCNRLLIVDGFERLTWLHQRLLLKQIRYPQTGILITSHRAVSGIAVLYQVRPSIGTLRQLTNELAPGLAINDEVLVAAIEATRGNMRESLMNLYDWFEKQPVKPGQNR